MKQDSVVAKYLINDDDMLVYLKSSLNGPMPDYDILARK